MAAALKYLLAAAGSTGNNTHAALELADITEQAQVGFLFVVEAIGATPTVTYKVQGSLDGVNWFDDFYITDSTNTPVATARTVTAVGATVQWNDVAGGGRLYRYYRLVTSANTNVTYRCEMYGFEVPR